MNLDRTLRSLAIGAIAATAACHIYVDEPPQPPPPPPHPAAPVAAAKPAEPEPKEVKVVPMHLHGVGPSQPAPGPGAALTTACLNTGSAAVGDCAAVQAPAACATAPTPTQKCNAYKSNLIPKVAALTVACMAGLNATQVCDSTSISTCARTALAQACMAPAVSQLCVIAATPCKTTVADCTSVLSGLSAQGQQAVAQCVAQGCAAGLSACIDGLAASVSTAH